MESTLLEHVEELFHAFKLIPLIGRSPMVGQKLIDQLGQSWVIEDETLWKNLNVSPSDQDKEDLPCSVVAAVDVLKAHEQIAECRRASPTYHNKVVGDKLSARHLNGKMEKNKSFVGSGRDVFEIVKEYGTTTRSEYNLRKLYTVTKPLDVGWFSTITGELNITGSSYHSIKDYKCFTCPNRAKDLGAHMGIGPFYGSFRMHESTLDLLEKENCFFRQIPGLPLLEQNHALMVYGIGSCINVEQPWMKEWYWVARNSWGVNKPLVVRGSLSCLETGIVPFV